MRRRFYANFEQTNVRDAVVSPFLSEIYFKTGVGITMPNTVGLDLFDLFAHCSVHL